MIYNEIYQSDLLVNGLYDWITRMGEGLDDGRFRFAEKECYIPVSGNCGLVTTCFAMRAAWQSGLWDKWSISKRNACIKFVKSFQKPSGFFEDPWLNDNIGKTSWRSYLNVVLGRVPYEKVFKRREMNLRAETRQAAATLYMVGEKSNYPLPVQLHTAQQAEDYFESFNWDHPWTAGSHLSHQFMLLSLNADWFGIDENYSEIINLLLMKLNSIQDKKTQCWYRNNPVDSIKINGAMKVFIGRQWLKTPEEDFTRLLEFALDQPFGQDGCHFFNRLFVVYQCLKQGKGSNRNYSKIKELAVQSLNQILIYLRDDGGFSFYPDKCQTGYYGAKTGNAILQSDMHGAAMFTWALAICSELLLDDSPACLQGWPVYKG